MDGFMLPEFRRDTGDVPLALVTGAARRIGRALATTLAGEGFRLVLHYHASADDAVALAAELTAAGSPQPIPARADLADLASITAMFESLPACPAVLVNNASLFEEDRLGALDPALWQRQMAVNLLAPAMLTDLVARHRRDGENALIVNMLDAKLAAPNPDFFSYTVSKAGFAGVTELSARALAPSVRVNAIAPAVTLVSGPQSRENFDRVHTLNPLHRGVMVADVARALRFIVQTPTLTGQTITIDSGQRFLSLSRDVQYMVEP